MLTKVISKRSSRNPRLTSEGKRSGHICRDATRLIDQTMYEQPHGKTIIGCDMKIRATRERSKLLFVIS